MSEDSTLFWLLLLAFLLGVGLFVWMSH